MTRRPSPAQRRVLEKCVNGDAGLCVPGRAWRRGDDLQTIKALLARGWITGLFATSLNDDDLLTITDAGRAALASIPSSQAGDQMNGTKA